MTAHVDRPTPERYSHGDNRGFDAHMADRTAGTDAAFFFPHLRPGMRLLDCGCGPGTITLGLAAAVAPGEVVGVDLRPEMVAAATALATERGVTTVRFEVGDIYALPFPDGAFDAAFAAQVLFHLREPLAALKELRRVLAPGGVLGIRDNDVALAIRTPSSPALERLNELRRRVLAHNGASPHYARNQRALLLEAGFVRSEAKATIFSVGTAESTRREAAAAAVMLRSVLETATEQGWTTPAEAEALLEELARWGERPDAFHVRGPMCEAVGWVGD